MTRGYRPVIAIGEAKKKAQAWGLLVFTLEPGDNLPFHFVICNRECISLVRVRRLKYPGYNVAAIVHSCRNEIEILRALPVTREIFRELLSAGTGPGMVPVPRVAGICRNAREP